MNQRWGETAKELHNMSAEQPTQHSSGEFGNFLKSKGINSTPLGNDADSIEMLELETKDLVNACKLLQDNSETSFDFLVLISSCELKKGYQSIYTLHSTKTKKSLRIKVTVPKDNSIVPTISHVWSTADWFERETYDMMGIIYTGHRNLKRILNPENWEGYPLRKDYIPPQDALNGPHPLTETEFAEKSLSKPFSSIDL